MSGNSTTETTETREIIKAATAAQDDARRCSE
jgi:hypothetical protein